MNYIEIGLPHTNLAVKLTSSPRPLLPVSGLSRKYLGIEHLSKSEMDSLTERLSKPKPKILSGSSKKRATKDDDEEEAITEEPLEESPPKTRFTGRKKMTKTDISSMIDRLTKGRGSDRVPDSRRVHNAQAKHKRGLTASYAWQGYGNYRSNYVAVK